MDGNFPAHKEAAWPKNRVVGFTDSVFAFAITLLVLNLISLRIPAGNQSLVPLLKENVAAFVSFVATFIIIARFWMSHLRLFAAIKETDRVIINANNALLFHYHIPLHRFRPRLPSR